MMDSNGRDSSDSLNSYFDNCEYDVVDSTPTIEYHARSAAMASPSDCEADNAVGEFTNMNEDPNDGMVIVEMDDGGLRKARRKATEVVIPIDSVSSAEVVPTSRDNFDESSDSCENSFIEMPHAGSDIDGNSEADETASGCSTPREEETDRSDIDELTVTGNYESDSNADEDSDNDGTADDNVREQTHETSGFENGFSNFMLSNASCLNICKKINEGTAKADEIDALTDRIRKHIAYTKGHNPPSSCVSLRMFTSLSASYKFRNLGYVSVDPTAPRTDVDNLAVEIKNQISAVGDTVENTQSNRASIPCDETPVENDSTSPVCSTRFDFTPAARSKIEGNVTVVSERAETANGALSVESGRENPQAKQDSEVRPNNQTLKIPPLNLQRRRHQQVLPPISAAPKGVQVRENIFEGQKKTEVMSKCTSLKSATGQIKADFQTRKQCSNAKPGIPHQLRSVACYHDGKVDVSITGDKRLITETEPLNVNINFIHRPCIQSKKEVKLNDAADDKNQLVSKNITFPLPTKSISPTLPQKGIRYSTGINSCARRPLPLLRNVPRTGNSMMGLPPKPVETKQICKIQSRKILPPLRNIPRKLKKKSELMAKKQTKIWNKKHNKKSGRKYDKLNLDIVNDRAQWPPFNTHVNAEASERHNKIFADISV